MATSRIVDYQQVGGTCGLYSLGMAISGVHQGVVARRDALLQLLLQEGNRVGTFVGEFMDANNLATVATNLGLTARVINFTDVRDFRSKLAGTGSDGVVMGYSVFDVPMYRVHPDLAAFKYLFSHWSVIEGMSGDNLTVRDPNTPGETRSVSIQDFHQSNQDAAHSSGAFSFQEFRDRTSFSVEALRNAWEVDELGARGGGHPAATPLIPHELPSPALNLRGRIVSVSGSVTGLQNFVHMKEAGSLRNNDKDKTVSRPLAPGTVVEIVDSNRVGRTFKLGLFSIAAEHDWVRTMDNVEGWVRKSALRK